MYKILSFEKKDYLLHYTIIKQSGYEVAETGTTEKIDSEYIRMDMVSIFMFTEPLLVGVMLWH